MNTGVGGLFCFENRVSCGAGWTPSGYESEDDLECLILMLSLPGAGITGVDCHGGSWVLVVESRPPVC